jgi:glycosyltransferase 2 family protein
MKPGVRRWLWAGISAAVLALIVFHLSRGGEWRNFSWDRMWVSITNANPAYLLAAVATTYASYLVRAYRWGFFLEPVKKASLRVLFAGQILGFSAIYLLGRAGEIVRPGYIAKRENVSYTSMAAVWLLERVYDTIFIALLFSASLFLVPLSVAPSKAGATLSGAHTVALLTLLVTAIFVVILVIIRLRADTLQLRTPLLLRFLSQRQQHYFERFMRSFADGLGVIQNWKDLWASLASTAVLWAINVTFFWLVFRSMGGGVGRLSWMAAALILFSGILGMLVQIPGIGGGFQVVVIKVMTTFLGIGVEDAAGASILIWIMMVFPCVALGLVMLVHEGLSLRKLESMAEEERAQLEEKL